MKKKLDELTDEVVKSILVCKFLGYDFVVNHPA